MNNNEKFLSDISGALISSGCTGEESRKIIYIITSQLENYDVNTKETGLAVPEQESEQLLKLYRGTLLTEGRSEKTTYAYIRLLERFRAETGKPLKEINSFDVRLWLAKMQSQVSLRTCENYRLYLSGFYSWLTNEELIEKNPVDKIKAVKFLEPEKKSFSETDIDALRSACKTVKERTMVELLLSSGVRVEELTLLDKTDINFNTLELTVRCGKGKKARTTYINEVTALYLKKYIDSRTDASDALIIAEKGSERIARCTVRRNLKELGKRSGIEDVHPHRFRRTFATNMHHRGMDIRSIQLLMGHSNINTTTKYIASDSERLKVEYKRHA